MILAIAWAGAAVLALVVAAFCGYELRWKLARLRRDLAGLTAVIEALRGVQDQLIATAQRAAQLSPPPGAG